MKKIFKDLATFEFRVIREIGQYESFGQVFEHKTYAWSLVTVKTNVV